MQTTQLRAGDRHLAAAIFEPDRSAASGAAVLFVHGMGSSQDGYWERARVCSQRLGAVCLTFDLSGHGRSDGVRSQLSPLDNLQDVATAYDALVAHPAVDASRVGACAASYGAYLSVLLAADRPMARLLLRAPALYDDRDLTTKLGLRRRMSATVDAGRVFAALQGLQADVLIVESGADEVIPHSVISTYLRHCPKAQHTVIPGAAHALAPQFHAAFLEIILDWFRSL